MHENEILVWLLSTIVLGIMFFYRQPLRQLPYSSLLMAAFLANWCAWLTTNLEEFFLYQIFNVLEHIGYALNGVLMLIWCWFVVRHTPTRAAANPAPELKPQ